MGTTEKHFVRFMSPGTFVSETTTQPIERWDPKLAVAMAERIVERHGAKPYGFQFETRLVADPIPDGRGGTLAVESIDASGTYFLGGKLETLDDVEARDDSNERILRSNMANNGCWIVCVNTNSYKTTMPLEEDSVLVDANGEVVERGDDPKHVAYRAKRQAARDAELAAMEQ